RMRAFIERRGTRSPICQSSRRGACTLAATWLMICFGCSEERDMRKEPLGVQMNDSSSQPPLRLSLTGASTQPHDHVTVRLTVTNIGNEPMGWDREFTAFVKWEVTAGNGARVDALHGPN